jgi:hypothetical protein
VNKKKLVLFIVLIVLVLAVIWSIVSAPRLKTVSSLTPVTAKIRQTEKKPSGAVAGSGAAAAKPVAKSPALSDERVVRLDMLEREQTGFKGYRRNIFKPLFTDEVKLMKQRSAAFKPLPVPPVAVVAQPVIPVQPAVQPETLQSTLSHFTFLGFLKKDNRKTIFLSKDKEIVLVRKGEGFAKRYEAIEITDQALTIRVIDSGEEIVIPLSENRPLAAAMKK